MSLHACGPASDIVHNICLFNRSKFVISPCCYGFIQHYCKNNTNDEDDDYKDDDKDVVDDVIDDINANNSNYINITKKLSYPRSKYFKNTLGWQSNWFNFLCKKADSTFWYCFFYSNFFFQITLP
jgi:hypothetical protein